ncbi:protein disulfide-isomerase A5-like [Hydractinia symbiolongicarpus]|uniref:protein disulfide-isomerase A5-like n=1 Tax=Hydractinia symbiolongicarpus TaxID=13093 RepID=UPI00254E9886|nr:protein disulfide-isomerase A5-like [Hydractinia symbiolongicarpus]XP_057305890.1 protein disulfide-isomerase A5-like [Hydractinia symbiolongicarpus]
MVVLAAILLGMVACSNAYVSELTDNTFLGYAKDKEVLLVNFYAPWCSDCQKLEPEFERAATNLGTRSLDLAKVDCFGSGKGLCEMYGVRSWPQLKNFNRGTYTGDYTGEQTAEALAGYITTVENSVPQSPSGGNPYAMAFPGAQSSYNRHKPSSPVGPAPPVVGAISCAKCNIEKPNGKGKISKHCSENVKKACVEFKQREQAKKQYDDDDKRSLKKKSS